MSNIQIKENSKKMSKVGVGVPYPLGCTVRIEKQRKGLNFSLFSSKASRVELCLFDEHERETRFELTQKTEDIWHIWLSDIAQGTRYGYRVYGEDPWFNPQKLLLDPYAKVVEGKPDLSSAEKQAWFELSDWRDNAAVAPKAKIEIAAFDWEADRFPDVSWANTIIYELHVKGFSQLQTTLPKEIRGTYAGLAHPTSIAYLQNLGITTVELLPINYFVDEPHLQQKQLQNYWGYNPLAMFAVEPKYWSGKAGSSPLNEFKTMVKALHQVGIEVILDVVFNHTAESEQGYPTFSQRGIDDDYYYWKDAQGRYLNWTGCGNMLNLSQPMSRKWVLDCLCYWVEECHVDGFRFDLATVLGRETPNYHVQAQLFHDIATEPRLQGRKFIAEPWDIGEYGYQVGNFPDYFAEWNDRFRDDISRFWLWQSGELGAFAERFAGSSDLYQRDSRKPHHSVNFITAHDGFTLHDAVSYNEKHNWANGEENRDGRNENYSYNHGIEGTDGLSEQVKCGRFFSRIALLRSLLLANGTPMLLAGDEFGNTQWGNNNAYCQDNEMAWLKWDEFDQALFEVVKQTIALRKKICSLSRDQWWSAENVQWLDTQGLPMTVAQWQNPDLKAMQIVLDNQWLFLINAKASLQTFFLPDGQWETIDGVHLNENQYSVDLLAFSVLRKVA